MPMPYRILIVLGLIGLLLVACTSPKAREQGLRALERNPLMAEAIADQMIEFVTLLQIRANERHQPIEDPAVLRAMDEAFVDARRMLERAEKQQDEGKKGAFLAKQDVFVKGEVLLLGTSLFFGYGFETDVAPGMRVVLAEHVAPGTEEELRSEPMIDLGSLQNIIGPQEYEVGALSADEWNRYRTVVLYSPPLKRILGYAQIRGKPQP